MGDYEYDFSDATYISVAERRKLAEKAAAKLAKKGVPLDPVSSSARTIATTFWGRAWCRHLADLADYEHRLPRGRSYLRNGAVLDLQILPGEVHGRVMGGELYEQRIRIAPLSAPRWASLRAACAGHIESLAGLLMGKFPDPVMAVLARPDDGLFPSAKEIRLDCDCPDSADLCKHQAALLYGVGVRLDTRPELLFTLRGVDPAELIDSALGAAGGLAQAGEKTLDADDSDLSALFGIDLAPEPSPALAPVPSEKSPQKPRKKKISPEG